MIQVHTFYEAVGTIVSAQTNRKSQEKLILDLMEGPNAAVRQKVYGIHITYI
jgi:exportin-1